MCTNPRLINKPHNDFDTRTGSVSALVSSDIGFVKQRVLSNVYGFQRDVIAVPCGKCVECLKKRQNDLAVRCVREASKRGSMHFLTLTYNDSSVPYQVRLERVDKETGEVFHDYPSSPLVRYGDQTEENVAFVDAVRSELAGIRPGSRARIFSSTIFETDSELYRYEITPSLYRRDVRLWLKRCRVRYFREKNRQLPDFSYVVCGEYGPRTCRPHYHICFFGLCRDDVLYFASQWQYGFWNLKTVNAVNPDGSNGFQIASQYVGKYMSKGKFECDSVTCGLSEKPRLMLSIGLGNDMPSELLAHYRAYDLFGPYDPETLKFDTGDSITSAQMRVLFQEIRKRSYFSVGEKKFGIPRSMLIKVWYKYYETTKSFRATQLRRLYSRFLQTDLVEDYIRKLWQDNPGIDHAAFIGQVREFILLSENSRQANERRREDSLRAFYNQSIF